MQCEVDERQTSAAYRLLNVKKDEEKVDAGCEGGAIELNKSRLGAGGRKRYSLVSLEPREQKARGEGFDGLPLVLTRCWG